MQKESILCDLVFIASNIENFVQAITFLKKRPSETLVDKLRVFDKVIDDIYKIPGKVANKDPKEIQSIAEFFKGKSNAQLIGMNIKSAVCFKYAPVTSAEADDIA
ncbi:L-aspartate oxidase [Trichinella spiralis]|uniref:L-aspartate oxidase n=1 Tax=Trichinella spiralis TaxID=6334 RepID=UPI0001EFC792|nr:L-aspartate oxidase [Trichinella spiralis]